jgi:hypothetical protein
MSVRMQRANNGHWRLSWGACALLLLLLLCAQAQAAVRTLVALDGPWRFQQEQQQQRASAPAQSPSMVPGASSVPMWQAPKPRASTTAHGRR